MTTAKRPRTNKSFKTRWALEELDSERAIADDLAAALRLIAGHEGRCLPGNAAQGDDMSQAYQWGSNAAFDQMAGIARAALARWEGK